MRRLMTITSLTMSLLLLAAPVLAAEEGDVRPRRVRLHAEVGEQETTIWINCAKSNPNEETLEINVRPTVFYPKQTGINYITVRGFTMRHAATNWAPPTSEQVGLIGTNWSKGWIIEDNIIITEQGYENMTDVPKEIEDVEKQMNS